MRFQLFKLGGIAWTIKMSDDYIFIQLTICIGSNGWLQKLGFKMKTEDKMEIIFDMKTGEIFNYKKVI